MAGKDEDRADREAAADREREERRSRLDARLGALSRAEEVVAAEEAKRSPGYAVAVKLGSEFVSAIVVGGLIGYLLDLWLGTTPWLMVVFLLLGFAAGVLNVLRSAGLISTPRPGNRTPRQDD